MFTLQTIATVVVLLALIINLAGAQLGRKEHGQESVANVLATGSIVGAAITLLAIWMKGPL